MSSETIDFTQEPKKAWLAFLIKQQSEAQFFIFVATDSARGLNVLDGLISGLPQAHQEELADDHKKIRAGSMKGGDKCNAREAYSIVSRFLATHYYNECQFGIVPTSTLKGDREAPKTKIPIRGKAQL